MKPGRRVVGEKEALSGGDSSRRSATHNVSATPGGSATGMMTDLRAGRGDPQGAQRELLKGTTKTPGDHL